MKLRHIFIISAFLIQSASCIEYAEYIGKAYSITALAFVILHYPLFKSHLRSLDLLQLCYLFTLVKTPIEWSWITFVPSFFTTITMGATNYLAAAGSLLSFTVCLVGVILISWIITLIVRKISNQRSAKFSQVFNFFKGPIRWVYPGLSFLSIRSIIQASYSNPNTGNIYKENLIGAGIVLLTLILYASIQLIQRVTNGVQKQGSSNEYQKWIEFLSLTRIMMISLFYSMSIEIHWYAFIAVYIVEIFYVAPVMFLNKWDNVVERIVFLLTEAVIMYVFSVYCFDKNYVVILKDIDFYAITAAFGIEVLYEIYKYIRLIRSVDDKSNEKVSPDERSLQAIEVAQQAPIPEQTFVNFKNSSSREALHTVSKNKGLGISPVDDQIITTDRSKGSRNKSYSNRRG